MEVEIKTLPDSRWEGKCQDCNWNYNVANRGEVEQGVYSHAKEFDHEVHLEMVNKKIF